MGDSDRRPQPALLVVILALLGLASIQNLTGPPARSPAPEEAKEEEEKPAPGAARPSQRERAPSEGSEARILAPLLEYYRSVQGGADPRDAAFGRSGGDGLLFLIATVPDPVRSTNSHRYDEWIGAIQRACESEGFVLDGFRMPWGARAPSAQATGRAGEAKAGAAPRADRESSKDDPDRDPGLLLFRGERTPAPIRVTPLLAVLLVPETPTLGIDKAAMRRSLELAAAWDVRNRPRGGAQTFRILGPVFSGSQLSLERALAGWTSREGTPADPVPPASFEVISGSASAIRVRDLQGCVRAPHRVRFAATVYQSRVLLRAVLAQIGRPMDDVAMLVEANTQFGRSNQPRAGTADEEPRYYPFPLHVSKVRGFYQKRGYLRDQSSEALQSFERLTIPFEEAGDATDIPPMQTPGITTAVDELVLGQILADISRRNIHTVGIVATDPLDTIFLARLVRQFVPDVRLFTTQGHVLYAHPQNTKDLRGMLVASTYPLFPQNQAWSYSYRGDATHVFFSSEAVQGTYNAVIVHLEELGDPRVPARFLEYGVPYEPPGTFASAERKDPAGKPQWEWKSSKRRPPVWISVVGNHGLYPVEAVTSPCGQDPDYLYTHDQREEEYTAMLGLPAPAQAGEQARSYARIRNWFRPLYQDVWLYVFAGASVACLIVAGLGALVYRWAVKGLAGRSCEHFRLGPLPLDGLAIFLNCCRAEGTMRPGAGRGPGRYLPIALGLLLVTYGAIAAPHLEVMWRVPWAHVNPLEPVEFSVTVVAHAVLGSLLAALALSLAARRLMARPAGADAAAQQGEGAAPGPQGANQAPAPPKPPRWVFPVMIAIVLVASLPVVVGMVQAVMQPGVAYAFATLEDGPRDALLRLARAVAIPSGVSPVLSMLFPGVAGSAWAYAQLRRRSLFEQFTPSISMTGVGPTAGPGDARTMESIRAEHDRIEEVLTSPARPLLTTDLIGTIVLTATVLVFTLPVVTASLTRAALKDVGSLSESVAGLLIAAIFALLGLGTLRLILLWRHVRRAMGLVLRLPLVQALDRVPSRIAAWFRESPRPGDGRTELIRRQALALARYGAVHAAALRAELRAPLGLDREIGEADWNGIIAGLEGEDHAAFAASVIEVREHWLAYWRDRAVAATFSDKSGAPKGEPAGEGGIGQELHALATVVAGAMHVPPPESPKRLPEWIHLAEDLLALYFLRWLAPSLAQVWTLVGSLVVGSLALMFAISSYPVPTQDRLLLGMGVLIGALAFMVLAIVVGFNRDELISRLGNTAPNRLKFDRNLVGGLFTYVFPLVGALAALSFSASDTLRAVLDPILRHLR